MSMMPASRVELKKDLTAEQRDETLQQIKTIAGSFNQMSRGEPLVVVVPTGNPVKLAQIRALPHVAKVGHQF